MKRYIGFALRSKECNLGTDNILSCKKTQNLILIDKSISAGSKQKIENFASSRRIDILVVENLKELTDKPNVKAISITNSNLAQAIKVKQNTI